MASQTLRTRDGVTNLNVCDTQTSGNLNIGASASRTGDIVIGHASQTASSLDCNTGAVDINATTGDCEIGTSGAGSTVYLGRNSADVLTRVGNGVQNQGIIIGSAQGAGTIVIGANASRSGIIDIGSSTATHQTRIRGGQLTTTVSGAIDRETTGGNITDTASGNITVTASGTGTFTSDSSTVTVEGATGTFLGSTATDAITHVGDGAVTSNIIIGDNLTSGDISIGAGVSRVSGGNLVMGAQVGGSLTQINAGNLDINSSVDAHMQSGTTTTIISGTTMDIQAGTTLDMTSVGNMVLDSAGTNELNASTTTLVKGGTGLTLTATTGALDMNADGGAVTLDSSTSTTITGGTTMDITAVGNMNINTTGTGAGVRDLYVEAKGVGGTTFLGSGSVDTTTRIHNAGATSGLLIASGQTSGSIIIGGGNNRTGLIQIGGPTADFLFNVRSGTMNIETKDSVGDLAITAADTLTMSAVDNLTIDSSAGDVTIQGIDMITTSASFVPTIGGTGGSNFTMNTANGSYWRWGNTVQVAIELDWSAKGTATGDIRIGNLPFAFPALPSGTPAPRVYAVMNKEASFTPTGGSVIEAGSSAGNTYMNVYEDGSILNVTDASSSGTVELSIMYMLS